MSQDNGIADLDAEEIAAHAVRGLTQNYPMRIKGTIENSDGSVIKVDIVRNFNDGKATVHAADLVLEVLRVGGNDYAKAEEAFWLAYGPPELNTPAAAARADGKWVKAGLYSSVLPTGLILGMHDNIWESIINDKAITKGARATVNGVPTITFKAPNIGTVHVATQGDPIVIRVESRRLGTLDYSEYGKPVEIKEPPAGEVIELTAVTGNGS